MPDYQAGFEAAEGYSTGPLAGQGGWAVESGVAEVTDEVARSGQQSVVLFPAEPATVIRRELAGVHDSDTAFVDFYVRGAAGEPPAETPEAFSPDVFHIALVREGAETGRFWAIDGDGSGGGEWAPVAATVLLDAEGRTLDWVRVSVRVDLLRKSFDIWVQEQLAGIDIAFVDATKEAFSSFALRGHPSLEIFFDDLTVGPGHPFLDNASADGIDDAWKALYSISTDADVRDFDLDGDGLTLVEEYFLGTDPTRADTSRDGLLDGEAVDLGVSPLVPSNVFPVSLPFFDGFEGWPLGDVHARGGWQAGKMVSGFGFQVSGEDGTARVVGGNVFQGERALRLDATEGPVAAQVEVEENAESVVWTDFYVDPAAHTHAVPPSVSGEATVALYFDEEGRAVAWDGLAGTWTIINAEPGTQNPGPPGWVRVTIRQDFSNQTWNLWLNSAPVAQGIGFASSRVSYGAFRVSQPESAASFDEVYIGPDEPPGLEPIYEPFFWSTGFEAEEGLVPGSLDGQDGWTGSAGAIVLTGSVHEGEQAVRLIPAAAGDTPHRADRYFEPVSDKVLWVTLHVQPQPGRLPDLDAIEGPRSALLAVNGAGYLFAYDGAAERWVNTGIHVVDPDLWARIDVRLDYETRRYWLCVEGVLVAQDLGFYDEGITGFFRFGIQGASGEEALDVGLDTMRIGADEPAGLDFSGDGLTNEEKRALGLDVFATDTTGDGLSDAWLVEHGLDASDPNIGSKDPYGTGLTVRESFLLGVRPDIVDTDGDGWSDFEEYLAATDPANPSSAPDDDGLAGWTLAGVGNGLAPYTFRVGDEYRILGSGIGTERNSDGFTFAYQHVSGNFEAVARVRAPEHLEFGPDGFTSWLAQNGLMARPSLDEDAPYSAVFSGTFWYWSRFRELAGGRAVGLAHEPVLAGGAKYVRMRRIGNRFRHYLSDDGQNWFLVSDVAVTMGQDILVGMFASANRNDLWVRGRLTNVEIVQVSDQSEWLVDDGAGSASFDSFAWMGEWDGQGDYDRAALVLREPSLQELHEAGLPTAVAFELPGAAAAATLGEWVGDGAGMANLGRRGWIEFDVDVAEADVFLVEVEGREHDDSRQAVSSFDLKLFVDEEYLGTRVLEATSSVAGHAYAFTPWLDAGTHRLRILWDGARSRTHLKVDAIRLRRIDGVDSAGNGIKDWVEDRLSRQSGSGPQPQSFTYVSPLTLEGPDRFNTRMRAENIPLLDGEPGEHRDVSRPFGEHPRGAVGRDFAPWRDGLFSQGSPVSVDAEPHYLPKYGAEWGAYLSAWSEPVSFSTNRGPGYRFWVDVPLAPLVDNAVTLSWQDGVAEERRLVRWIPYNVLEAGEIVLRAGDSMLLTAHEGDQQSGQVFIQIGGESFETTPASPLVYTFSEVGEYFVEGTYLHPNGQHFSGTLHVSVQDFSFAGRPLAYVGRQRDWAPGEGAGEGPVFESDPRLRLQDPGNETLRFDSENNDFKTIAARVPGEGVILDSVEVESFRVFSSWETYAKVVDTFPDGTKLVEMMMILSPVPDDVRVRLRIFVGGILFDDGTIQRWLGPDDFDELGQVTFRFIMPEEAITSVCHRTYVYQDEKLIGVR